MMQTIADFEMFIATAEGGSAERPAAEEALSSARQRLEVTEGDDEAFGEWQHIVVQLEAILDEYSQVLPGR